MEVSLAEDQGKEEEKLEVTPEGEALGYISLDQARVLALQDARDNREIYGRYAEEELAAGLLRSYSFLSACWELPRLYQIR